MDNNALNDNRRKAQPAKPTQTAVYVSAPVKTKKGDPLPDHLFIKNNQPQAIRPRQKRSRFITLFQAATKSCTNFA